MNAGHAQSHFIKRTPRKHTWFAFHYASYPGL